MALQQQDWERHCLVELTDLAHAIANQHLTLNEVMYRLNTLGKDLTVYFAEEPHVKP